MRVCSPSLGYALNGSGGSVYEHHVLAGLAEKDEVHTPITQRARRRSGPGTARCEPFRAPRMHWTYATPFYAAALARCWRAHGFDVIRCHSPLWLGPACVWAGRRYGVPVVMHQHHWEPAVPALERWALTRAAAVVVDSGFVARQLVPLSLRLPVPVVPCGVDMVAAFGVGWRTRYHIPPDAKLLVALGPMVARKQPLDAMLVMRRVVEDVPNAYALWMGDGPLRAKAAALVERMGVADRVRLPGFVPEADKRALLASADVFLHLSELEGWPLAVMEAMAAGVPVVARHAASLPEIITEGREGYLRAGSLGEVIGCAIYLLEQDVVRRHMSHHARIRAAEFPWSRTVEGVRAVLAEAVAAHQR